MRNLSLVPEVCVCLLSYKRLDLLRTTLASIVEHLETAEAGLAYELVWVDNGSDEAERHALHREFRFEKALMLGTNYGIAYGFNTLFFRLCSAPYFLTLEEDWEWIASKQLPPVGHTILRDAMAVLQHDTGVSGVFLRPDTLDQFLRRSEWKRIPLRGGATRTATLDAFGGAAGGAAGGAYDGVEYATYCMDRSAAYLWGAYSNGPGLYDRERLLRRVGRQFGEPTDRFPDPMSEGNYCYRIGAAGLCSAVLRVWPGCEGVHHCNAPLFRHLGDERSHGYGKGRRTDVRWLLSGSNASHDTELVAMRALDVEPTVHALTMYVSGGEALPALSAADGRIALLVGASARSLRPVVAMARAALRSVVSPELLEVVWLLPHGAPPSLSRECADAAAALSAELASAGRLPPHRTAAAFTAPPLRCVAPARAVGSIGERFAALAAASDAPLLMLCPHWITAFDAAASAAPDARGSGAAQTSAPQVHGGGAQGQREVWDAEVRRAFFGARADGDVRIWAKDRLMLLQGASASPRRPAAHAILHRDALDQLGYAAPPVSAPAQHAGLLSSLWLQAVFGSVGRYHRLGSLRTVEAADAAEANEPEPELGADGAHADGAAAGVDIGGGRRPPSALRLSFERSAAARAIDTHRVQTAMLLLRPKSRTAFERASAAYAQFAQLYNEDALVDAWPALAELTWNLQAVERSDDWELRDTVGASMLPAAQDLEARLLDRFASAWSDTE